MCGRIRFDLVDWKGLVTNGVHVEVDTSVMIEDKVTNSVCTLNREWVVIPNI